MSSDESPWRDAEGWWTLGHEVQGYPHYRFELYYTNLYRSGGNHLNYVIASDHRYQGNDSWWTEFSAHVSYRRVKNALKPTFRHGRPVEKEPHVEKNYEKFTPIYKLVRSGRVPSIANARRMQVRFAADKKLQEHLHAAAYREERDDSDGEYKEVQIADVERAEIPIGTPMILELEFRCNRPLDGNIRARLPADGDGWGKDLVDPLELEVYREVSKARLIDARTGRFVPGWVPYNNDDYDISIHGNGTDSVKIGVPRFVAWTGPWWRLLLDPSESDLRYDLLGLDGPNTPFRYSYSVLPPLRHPKHPATIVPDNLFTYDEERRMGRLSVADAALAMRVLQKRQRDAEDMYRPGAVMERLNKQRLEEAMQEAMGEGAACVPNLSALRL